MKVKITYLTGEVEEHEIDDQYSSGVTAIGYSFHSKATRKIIIVHPCNAKKIEEDY